MDVVGFILLQTNAKTLFLIIGCFTENLLEYIFHFTGINPMAPNQLYGQR
jgi:hypothetical protein